MAEPFAFGHLHRCDGHAHPGQAAIRFQIAFFLLEPGYLAGVEPGHVIQVFLHVVRVGDAHPVQRAHLGEAASGDLGKPRVQLQDSTIYGIDQGDADGRLLEQDLESAGVVRPLALSLQQKRPAAVLAVAPPGDPDTHEQEFKKAKAIWQMAEFQAVAWFHEEPDRQPAG